MAPGSQSGSQKARDTLSYLRAQIVDGHWRVGTLIPKEPELMDLIGVGKSTVREAVRALATLGMLQTVPGVGTYVRGRTPASSLLTDFLSDHDIEEVLVYRRSLEIEAAQTAAVRRTPEQLAALRDSYRRSLEPGAGAGAGRGAAGDADDAAGHERCNDTTRDDSFHRLIVEASGSRLLIDLYAGVMQTLNRAVDRGLVYLGATPETIRSDHGALLEAIEARDVRHAAHSMALHADRDLGLRFDAIDFLRHTERAETLIEAGFEPRIEEPR